MMNNLFSIFDPHSSIMNLSLNWISAIMGILFLPVKFWFFPSRSLTLMNSITMKLHQEMSLLINKNKSTTFMFISLFIFIFFNNFLSLFPYIFNSSSHLVFTLSLSLPLWISFMIYGWIMNTNHMFTHLVPQNTPMALMSFMVIIETISNIIRPGTLAIRLMANMIAGHLLLTLLSSMGLIMPSYLLMLMITAMLMLLILEIAVSMIQAYVFMTLSTLYSSEIN